MVGIGAIHMHSLVVLKRCVCPSHGNVQAGGVVLNDSPSVRVDSQPYGGLKDSGIQREGVKYAMEDMLEHKVLVMRNVGVL